MHPVGSVGSRRPLWARSHLWPGGPQGGTAATSIPLLFSLPCRLDAEESIVVQPGPSSEPEAEQDVEVKEEAEGEAVLMEEDLIQQSLDDYDAGKYSPRLLGTNELPFDAHVLEAEEDTHRLLLLRQQLQVTGRRTLLGSGRCVCSGVQGWRECCPPGEHEAGPEHAVSGREVCRAVSGTQLSPMDKWVRSFPLPAASLSRTGLQTSRKDIWDAFPSIQRSHLSIQLCSPTRPLPAAPG